MKPVNDNEDRGSIDDLNNHFQFALQNSARRQNLYCIALIGLLAAFNAIAILLMWPEC